jgi:hypothetical protein
MKHLLTAIACFFALSMSAQEALPWNPNANGDNIIGTVDLLAMLNVYGEEYSVQTCFKGEIYRAKGFNTFYIPNDCGTLWATRPYGGGLQLSILQTEGYVDGDVIHVVIGHDYIYEGTSSFAYIGSDGVQHGIASIGSWGLQDCSTKFVFSDGAWTWDGNLNFTGTPTVPPNE